MPTAGWHDDPEGVAGRGPYCDGDAWMENNSNRNNLDANCANANPRSPSAGVMFDERKTSEGSDGGLRGTSWRSLF